MTPLTIKLLESVLSQSELQANLESVLQDLKNTEIIIQGIVEAVFPGDVDSSHKLLFVIYVEGDAAKAATHLSNLPEVKHAYVTPSRSVLRSEEGAMSSKQACKPYSLVFSKDLHVGPAHLNIQWAADTLLVPEPLGNLLDSLGVRSAVSLASLLVAQPSALTPLGFAQDKILSVRDQALEVLGERLDKKLVSPPSFHPATGAKPPLGKLG